jgi:hypothetical protein
MIGIFNDLSHSGKTFLFLYVFVLAPALDYLRVCIRLLKFLTTSLVLLSCPRERSELFYDRHHRSS